MKNLRHQLEIQHLTSPSHLRRDIVGRALYTGLEKLVLSLNGHIRPLTREIHR